VNTPYPWQTKRLISVLPNYTNITPSIEFTPSGYQLTQFDLKSENQVEIFTPLNVTEGVDTSFTAAEGYSTTPNDYTSSHPDWEGRPFTDSSPQEFPDQWFNVPADGKISCTGLFKNIRTAKPLNARVGDIVKASVDFDFGNTANQADDERTFMLSLSDIGSYLDADEGVLNHSDLSFFIKFTENNNGFAQAKLMQRIEGSADIYVGALGLNALQGNLLRLELEIDVKSTAATTTVKVSYQNVTDSVSMANNPKTITGVDSAFYTSLVSRDAKVRMNIQAGELTDTLIGTINIYDASFKNLVSIDTDQLSTITPTTKIDTSNDNISSFVYATHTYTRESSLENDRPRYSGSSGSSTTFSISWNGSAWVRQIQSSSGGVPPTPIHNRDTPFPWLELDGSISSSFSNFVGSTVVADFIEVTGNIYDTSATHLQIEDATVGSFQANSSPNPIWAYPGPHPAFNTYIRQSGLVNGKPSYSNVVPDDGSFEFLEDSDDDPSNGQASHMIFWNGSAWISEVSRYSFNTSEIIHTRNTPEPWIERDGSISSDFILQSNTRFNGRHKLIYKSSDKLIFKTPNGGDTRMDSFNARIELSKLDTYIAPSKYKKYTENIQQIKDKLS